MHPNLKPEEFFMSNDWEPEVVPIADFARAHRMGLAKHFETATIAHNLVAEADKHVSSGTVISIVGNDLPNVAKEDYPWAATLQTWLQRGANVRYFAIEPSDKALAKLREIAAQSTPGKLEVRRFRVENSSHDAMKVARLWRTFHFVIFDDQKAPQFWAESYHPRVFTEARDCFYFGPESVKEIPQYELCRTRFEHMFNNSADVLI